MTARTAPGESGLRRRHHSQDAFPQAESPGDRPDPGAEGHDRVRRAPARGGARRRPQRRRPAGRAARAHSARCAGRRPRLRGRQAPSSVTFEVNGDDDATERARSSRSRLAVARRAARHPGLRRRPVRRRQRRARRSTKAIRGRLRAGRDAVAADDAGHPARSPSARWSRPGCPLLLALTAVVATIGLLGARQPARHRSTQSARSVILLIGLAVGVDYSLFYLRREREERARGRSDARRVADRRRDLGPRRARLRHDRDGGDGRACSSPATTTFTALRARHDRSSSRWPCSARSRCCPRCCRCSATRSTGPRCRSWAGAPARPSGARLWAGGRSDRVAAPPAALGRARRRRCSSLLAVPALGMHTANAGIDDAAARPADHADLRPHAGRVPRRRRPGRGRGPGRRRAGARGRRPRSTRPRAPGARDRASSASRSTSTSARTARSRSIVAADGAATATTSRLEAGARRRCATTSSRRPSASVPAPRPTSTGMAAGSKDFNDLMTSRAPFVFAFVLGARVPAAAGHVPVARDRRQGDRAEPAVGRRGLRRARAGSSSTATARGCSASSRNGGDRVVAAAVPVRDPVRAVDGLPRVHPQPDPRGATTRDDTDDAVRARDPRDGRRRSRAPRS